MHILCGCRNESLGGTFFSFSVLFHSQAAYVLALSQEVANEGTDVNIRVAAGLALKNTLTAREQTKKDAQAQRWTMLDAGTKAQMKNALLMALASPQIRAGSVSAQVIASVAALEIPRGEWNDLIAVLLNNVTTDQPNLKLASLQTIGYICETIVRSAESFLCRLSLLDLRAYPLGTPFLAFSIQY